MTLTLLLFIAIFSFIQVAIADAGAYKLHLLDQSEGAACLDGSPPGFYLHEGAQSDKYMIFFDSGGFCGDGNLADTLESCYHRSFTGLGTTTKYPPEKKYDGTGVLSTSKDQNPLFYDWNKIFVIYCDGTEYQGSRNDTIAYKDRNLHFRGALNVLQFFKHMEKEYDMFNKDKIVITGISAGGIATYHWSNYAFEHSKKAKVYAIPDSGMFLVDYFSPLVKAKVIRERAKAMMELIKDVRYFPIPECLRDMKNDTLLCFDAQNVAKYLKAPMLIVESSYDSWSIQNLLAARCLTNTKKPYSLSNCNETERKAIDDYATASRNAIRNIISLKQSPTSVWSPACAQHGFTDISSWNSPDYKVPTGKGVECVEAMRVFLENPNVTHSYIDEVNWPLNSGCSGMSSYHLHYE